MERRRAEASCGIPAGRLTRSLWWSAYSLRETWNQVKNTIAPWWADNSKEAYASGLANLAAALGNWDASKNGKRRGPKVRFPGFKGQTTRHVVPVHHRRVRPGRGSPACGGCRVSAPCARKESTRKLARHVGHGRARIRSATLTHQGGRWCCSLSVEITRIDPAAARPGGVVGVDLGVTSLAVLSTGEVIANPRHLEAAQREPRRLGAPSLQA
jgi:putative transposase